MVTELHLGVFGGIDEALCSGSMVEGASRRWEFRVGSRCGIWSRMTVRRLFHIDGDIYQG